MWLVIRECKLTQKKKDTIYPRFGAQQEFEILKTKMTQTLVLMLPNFIREFVVETNTSSLGIGAALTQDGYPLAYFSKKLSKKLTNVSTYVRELYVIAQVV